MSLHYLLAAANLSIADLFDRPGYDENHLAQLKLFFALFTLVILYYEASREMEGNPVPLRWKKIVAGILGVAGVVAYFQFFQIGYKEFYHRWEFFHYYVGSKYYKEIGFEGIYTCAAVAEFDLGYQKEARTRKLRDLRENLIVPTKDILEHPERCKAAFTPERWDAFKADIDFFRRVSLGNYWTDMQKDHGYNPPPVWGLTGWLFSSLHPATEGYCQLLSSLDILLFSAMFGMVGWAFGWRVMCVALIFWGTQDASPFYWTGGAFLRQDWLFYTIASACMLRKQKYFWGGAFLMYGTLLRVFPLFFFAGWIVVAAAQLWRSYKKGAISMPITHRKVLAGSVAAALVLIPASSMVHGWRAWPDFIHHISVHNSTPLTNHMGWKTIVAHRADGRMAVAKDPKLTDPFEKWKDMRRERVQQLKVVYLGGIAVMFGAFCWACWRLKNLWIVEALGCLLVTIGVELTCYYYSYFIFGAMLSKVRRHIEWALLVTSALTEIAHLQLNWFDDRFTAMSVAFLVLSLFMVMLFSRRPWKQAATVMTPAPVEQQPFRSLPSTEAEEAASLSFPRAMEARRRSVRAGGRRCFFGGVVDVPDRRVDQLLEAGLLGRALLRAEAADDERAVLAGGDEARLLLDLAPLLALEIAEAADVRALEVRADGRDVVGGRGQRVDPAVRARAALRLVVGEIEEQIVEGLNAPVVVDPHPRLAIAARLVEQLDEQVRVVARARRPGRRRGARERFLDGRRGVGLGGRAAARAGGQRDGREEREGKDAAHARAI